jgi:GAF domain-containing protein
MSVNDRTPVWAIWLLIAFGALQPVAWILADGLPRRPVLVIMLLAVWVTLLVLAGIATHRIGQLWERLTRNETAHQATRSQVDQLQTQNGMLEILARSADVPLAFQALASRLAQLVPCDRLGLALLSEEAQEFQTYTARVQGTDRGRNARPDVVFKMEGTLIGRVVRSREPLIIDDARTAAPDFLDANVLVTAGFRSVLIVPLISKDRAVGTLNLVSRTPGRFGQAQISALQPIAELLAVAWVAQQLQVSLGRFRTMEAMSELTLSIAAEINSALQTIVGNCDLIERQYPDEHLRRDLATVVRQAERIAGLLEKMRKAADERLRSSIGAVSKDTGTTRDRLDSATGLGDQDDVDAVR